MKITRKIKRLFNQYYGEPAYTSKLYHNLSLLDAKFPIFPDGASGNSGLLYTLLKFLWVAKPKNVLELGTGQSSSIMSLYCQRNLKSFCLSVENNEDWFNLLSPQLQSLNHNFKKVSLIEHPTTYNSKHRISNFYNLSSIKRKYNLILLDGPFGGLNRYGFIKYIDAIIDLDNFILIIDDTNRKEESEMADIIEDILITDFKINIYTYSIYASKYQRIILSPKNHYLKTI